MNGRRAHPLVGLPAQGAVNGTHRAPVSSATSTTRAATSPATCPARLLAVKASAVYLGVCVRTIWNLVDLGHLHPVRLPGLRRVAFDIHELEALVEASRD